MTRRTQLERARDEFLDEKSTGKESGNYRRNASRVLEKFIDYVADGCPDYDALQVPDAYRDDRGDRPPADRFDQLDVGHAKSYARLLRRRVWEDEIAGSTANTYYSYVRAFFEWAVEHEYIDENPAAKRRARDQLPDDDPKRTSQQMWTSEQRRAVLKAADERAAEAFDEDPNSPEARKATRDHALAALLAYSGLRGGEVLRDPNDVRREGATWGDLSWPAGAAPTDAAPADVREARRDDGGTLEVLGKSGDRETATVLEQAIRPLRRYYRVLQPPSADWPIFPTFDKPTLYGLLDDTDGVSDPFEAVRDAEIIPPATTTETGRRVMRRLCSSAELDLGNGFDYLQPHGGRRGLGDELYLENPRLAQDVLRHQDIETTQSAYRERKTEEDAGEASRILDEK